MFLYLVAFQKFVFQRMLLGKSIQNVGKVAQWEVCKNRGELQARRQARDENLIIFRTKTWTQNQKFD